MARVKQNSEKINMQDKLDYIGLELDNLPKTITNVEPLEFGILKSYDETQYRQYRHIPVKNIQILLSPTNRLDDLEMRYRKASPLWMYLDSSNEENVLKHTTFLKMLKSLKIDDIEKVAIEQERLEEKTPFKVKFEGNYLWQIYYSENTKQYFMLVPTEDTDYSTFFYLLKKKLENTEDTVFVPVRNVAYSTKYLKKSEFEDISNYIWLFTNEWPYIYEVYDSNNNMSIHIVGETLVYGKVKSMYKIKLKDKTESIEFYKLLKALFILQTELPQYFEFNTKLDKYGKLNFMMEDESIEYKKIPSWINGQYEEGIDRKAVLKDLIKENKSKLSVLKTEAENQEIEYLIKEKQISTFLECKKTFLGKVKYFFKYSKNSKNTKKAKNINAVRLNEEEKVIERFENLQEKEKNEQIENKQYTIEELMSLYKQCASLEDELKKIVMDINALKLKNKNMKKKIENATKFIEEIDNHKKSIFEFWKYSNKDEVECLTEGEEEEINIIKKATKTFDYKDDFENFGQMMDNLQRKKLSKDETDGVYITTTNLLEILNKVKTNEATPRDIELSFKEIKKELKESKLLTENEEFDIFGATQESSKTSEIVNKKHRELPKNKFKILDVNINTKQLGYKLALENVIKSVKQALQNVVLSENLSVYKVIEDNSINIKKFNVFNINPEDEILEAIDNTIGKINLLKINLKRGTNAVSYTNSIFFDNQNKTLPIGQDLSTKILVDTTKMQLVPKKKNDFKILKMEDEKDDFSKIKLKSVTVIEYDLKD